MSNNNQEELNRKAIEAQIRKAQDPIKGEPTANQSDVRGNKSSEPSGIDQESDVNDANQQAVTGESPQSITAAQAQTEQAGKDASGTEQGFTVGTAAGNVQHQEQGQAQEQAQQKSGSNKKGGSFSAKNLVKQSNQSIAKADEKQSEKQKVHDLLQKAVESTTRFDRIVIKDEETGEVLGTKIVYLADKDNKTVYDYAADETVGEHIGFVIPEEDNKDGEPVNQQVTFYWINPQF